MGGRIIIRADASTRIGSGHVMRCLTLAEELRDINVEVSFISRAHPGNLNELIREKGFQCLELPESSIDEVSKQESQDPRTEYASWLGVTQQQDARETIKALGDARADWLIADHYGLDEEWETLLRPHAHKIMVIDDLADRRHDSDLLLDQNYFINGVKRYYDLAPPYCTKLMGPKYALLSKKFLEARKNPREISWVVKRVFVFFGGSDLKNITGLAIKALMDPELMHLHLDVVIGSQNPNREKIEKLIQERHRSTLHIQTKNMAELMSNADLSIGAAGSTSWERCCLGLPSLVVCVAENQKEIVCSLHNANIIKLIGYDSDITPHCIQKAVRNVLELTSEHLRDWSMRCSDVCDGRGTERVLVSLVNEGR